MSYNSREIAEFRANRHPTLAASREVSFRPSRFDAGLTLVEHLEDVLGMLGEIGHTTSRVEMLRTALRAQRTLQSALDTYTPR